MKNCPKCSSSYSTDIKFCLVDGTPLIEEIPPTIKFNSDIVIPKPTPSAATGINPLFAILPTALLALIVGGMIAYWLLEKSADNKNAFQAKQSEVLTNKQPTVVLNSPKVEPNLTEVNPIQQYRVRKTNDGFLSLREEANTEAKEIIKMPFGSIIEVDTDKGIRMYKGIAWFYVNYKGNSGWASSKYLEKQ